MRHAYHRIVHRLVAVGVVFAQHLPHHPRRLLGRLVGGETHVVHGVEDAPLNGFQAVAGIGQGAGDDDAHGVAQKGVPHLLVYVYFLDNADFHSSG